MDMHRNLDMKDQTKEMYEEQDLELLAMKMYGEVV
jgi:hypothetical protein